MLVLSDIKRDIEQEAYRFYEQHTKVTLERHSNGNIAIQGHNDALDAFRHAYTSGRVTQLAADNQWISEYFGNQNEIGEDHLNDPYEHRMDLWNNEIGRRVGDDVSTKEELARRLAQELNNGDLITDLNDQRLKDLYPNDPRLQLPPGDLNRNILTEDDVDKINDDIEERLDNLPTPTPPTRFCRKKNRRIRVAGSFRQITRFCRKVEGSNGMITGHSVAY